MFSTTREMELDREILKVADILAGMYLDKSRNKAKKILIADYEQRLGELQAERYKRVEDNGG